MSDPQAQPEPFKWTRPREDAAVLVAEDALTNEAIAVQVKISPRTLQTWKQHPEFKARVAEHLTAMREHARASGLGRLDVRMARYKRRAELLDLIQQERADDPAMETVPGGRSGFLVRQIKIVSSGEGSYTVDQYVFDHQLHREMRELERQAAQDAGDWSERIEHGGEVGTVVIREIRVPRPDGDA